MISQSKTTTQRLLEQIMQPTHSKKFLFFFIIDSAIIIFSLAVSFLLRLDFNIQDPSYYLFPRTIPLFLGVKLASFTLFRLYKLSWRFVSLKDLYNIIKAVFVSSFVLMIILFFFRIDYFYGFPRSVLIIDSLLTLVLIGILRISKRVFSEVLFGARHPKGKKTIIAGAGNTGEMILRDLKRNNFKDYAPIALLDDDPNRIGTYLHGIKVMGRLDEFSGIVNAYRIEAFIVAVPSLTHKKLRALYTSAKRAGIKEIKIVPRLYEFTRPEMHIQDLEDIKIEDLIGRQAVKVNYEEMGRIFGNKSIMITGAAGSIGSEIVRQLCRFNPRELILFEIDETDLYTLELSLRREFPNIEKRIKLFVGDVRDRDRLHSIFELFKPEVVFHAAAYKHVPMMEFNAAEAVKVNIFGTYNVAQMASLCGVERFVMISTDKAVRPTSIMGATKRAAEGICHSFNTSGSNEYLSVRFGNVLGSRGSVLPLFLEQMQKGGPITITHKDMRRFFMTIPEAVSLVLQASVIGRGGDVMVLDMGDPVKIVDLAEELLKMHGLRPYEDIDIKFIGIRPGEKLFEEVLTAEEGTIATRHEKVFIARAQESWTSDYVDVFLNKLKPLLSYSNMDGKDVRSVLKEYIQWYGDEKIKNKNERQLIPFSKENVYFS